jgi:hypothetical protein
MVVVVLIGNEIVFAEPSPLAQVTVPVRGV